MGLFSKIRLPRRNCDISERLDTLEKNVTEVISDSQQRLIDALDFYVRTLALKREVESGVEPIENDVLEQEALYKGFIIRHHHTEVKYQNGAYDFHVVCLQPGDDEITSIVNGSSIGDIFQGLIRGEDLVKTYDGNLPDFYPVGLGTCRVGYHE